MSGNVLRIGAACVMVIGMLALAVNAGPGEAANHHANKAASQPTSKPHEPFGKIPAPIAQTIKQQNSPQDMLQVDITHSQVISGKNVAYIRVVWGDLDDLIKHGGKQYYSDWDGQLAIDNASGEVIHKIAFDDGRREATTRPAATSRPANHAGKKAAAEAIEKLKAAKAQHFAFGPGTGSGRDELTTPSGPKITWQAGVVGAYDGLLIKITSDNANISATLVAGKFTVPIKITPGQ